MRHVLVQRFEDPHQTLFNLAYIHVKNNFYYVMYKKYDEKHTHTKIGHTSNAIGNLDLRHGQCPTCANVGHYNM